MSFVTLGEPTKWIIIRSWGVEQARRLAKWRRNIAVLPNDERTAQRGANSKP